MATFENPELKTSFTIPDRLSVRQQLRYRSCLDVFAGDDGGLYIRAWRGAVSILENWQSEILPDKDADLDAIDDPKAADVAYWVANVAAGHYNRQHPVEPEEEAQPAG